MKMKFRGGARLGVFNVTWPFVTLEIESATLLLRVLSAFYTLKREEVQRLEYFRGWFPVGVMIVHTNSSLDNHTVFWSFKPEIVLTEAAKRGYLTSA